MKVQVLRTLPATRKGDILCRFKNLRDGSKTQKGSNRAFEIQGEASRVILNIDVAAFGQTEPQEARRIAGASALKECEKLGGKRLFWLCEGQDRRWIEDCVAGLLLCGYRFDAFKRKAKEKTGTTVAIVCGKAAADLRKRIRELQKIDTGVRLARDLANTPPNHLTPGDLAQAARRHARRYGLSFKALKGQVLVRGGYVGLCAVGGASKHPPVLFELAWRPRRVKRGAGPLCLVGKGITFDSGGLDLKGSRGMWQMKGDMSGAACVIGALCSISLLRLPVPVVGVVACAENLPGGGAYRQGDVLRYRNGKTVEIRSTDAEGRLILADALLYAQQVRRQKRIVEFSTLTGACMRALGRQYTGLLSRSPELKEKVKQAAAESGERVWELPLHPEYRKLLESPVADFSNVGGRFAGAQTAAWFLQEFIEQDTEFVHLDIAGTFITEKEDKYWGQVGATGVGVRLAVCLAQAEAS